ncbi:MAG: peroxiredoxin-like family protein [Xenococcaceae cyanobacterium MO_167.B52]|nr:peroxiredoxin-like family protein [Xenococcaceae cyanobacterium MO_167.B52]
MTSVSKQDVYSILSQTQSLRVRDGETVGIFDGCEPATRLLVIIWGQLGDFDNLEYAWWLKRESEKLQAKNITVRAIGIGDRKSGQKFCEYTEFPESSLYLDLEAEIHHKLGLYTGLSAKMPFLSTSQNSWLNLMLMCAGIGSPGTLKEVFRGYTGDRSAPQLIDDEEVVKNTPLPAIKGSFFKFAGGQGFQRPFELATLRLQNMTEVLSNWKTYVPNSAYLTQRGATFLFDSERNLLYEHRDQGILGFAENMSKPLSFLDKLK